ncbi:hypothetical protein ACFQY0_06410 [Haloferula chungangensis]|uniref:Secreted protein n=1 Tax=Haloferula chungangensis TaxID=1048331 RepID=A0ABW2L6V0_9BACT
MKRSITSYTTALVSAFAVISLSSCDVDTVEEGEMPSIDVDAEKGKMPKVEVTEEGKLPSVDVDAKGGKLPKVDIDGPDIDVGSKKVEIEVPTVDVDLPDDDEEGQGDESPADAKD